MHFVLTWCLVRRTSRTSEWDVGRVLSDFPRKGLDINSAFLLYFSRIFLAKCVIRFLRVFPARKRDPQLGLELGLREAEVDAYWHVITAALLILPLLPTTTNFLRSPARGLHRIYRRVIYSKPTNDATSAFRGEEAILYPVHSKTEHALLRELGRPRKLRRTAEGCKEDCMEGPGRTPG